MKDKYIAYYVSFWSSHSYIKGEWVCLEIVNAITALDTTDMEGPKQYKGVLRFNICAKSFNVYHIDHALFEEIITYIDKLIELDKSFQTKKGIDTYIEKQEERAIKIMGAERNIQLFYDRFPN